MTFFFLNYISKDAVTAPTKPIRDGLYPVNRWLKDFWETTHAHSEDGSPYVRPGLGQVQQYILSAFTVTTGKCLKPTPHTQAISLPDSKPLILDVSLSPFSK